MTDAAIPTENITILYVDDEQMNLFLFKQNFEDDYSVLVASSGAEALEILADNDSTNLVVITDYMMPGMNGLEFIEKAQDQYGLSIFFMLTGYCGNKELVQALRDKTIYDCFSKPINIDRIELKIQEALANLS